MNYRKIVNLSVLLVFFVSLIGIHAEGVEKKKSNSLFKTNGNPTRTNFNINNISTWLNNNGDSDLSPSGDSGFEFPKGSNRTVFYESGFVWGASIDGEKRVGGNTYNQGILPGAIVNGVAEDPSLEHVRIYRVRKDWEDGDVQSEMKTEEATEADVRARYQQDWNEWPASFGAPYEDVDGNGSYDASTDIPGFPGADQTIWFVANDFDATTARSLYGSDPMGIELQATFWGYQSQTALGNTMFRKYKIINKSVDVFDSMYVSMWSDPDLGGAGDDYVGCDVDLSLMFVYNGDGDDTQYGSTVPAGGFDFFQGPIVKTDDPNDIAIFDNKERPGYVNLPMSAHYFFINSDDVYTDPDLANYVDGTLQFHNLFRGKISSTGAPFVDPTTGKQTKFTLSGDVATQTGWVDGILHSPADRRQGMVAGPFTMAPGDTQEVVVAQIAAGGFGSVDRLGAVALLKFYDEEAQNTYDNFFQVPPSPKTPEVTISELDQEIILTWDENVSLRNEIEGYDILDYIFQGYVVYQFPSAAASIQDAKIVATYDLIDGIGKVIGDGFNTEQGVVLPEVKKFGLDSGVKRFISIKDDLFNSNAPITNGTSYYYAVSSYAVNKNLEIVPVSLESNIIVNEAVPKTLLPGEDYDPDMVAGTSLDVEQTGTANASVVVEIVDPHALTGSDYEMFFDEQHYYLDKDNVWKETNYADSVGSALNKPGDQTPSTLLPMPAIFAPNNTLDLHFEVAILAPDYNYADGVQITFPAGIQINSAADGGSGHVYSGIIDGQTVTWGAEDTTGDGGFAGGEDLMVNIDAVDPTFSVDFVIYDDGWSESYIPTDPQYFDLGAGTVNGTGSVTLTGETGFQFKTEQHWNVRNVNSGDVVVDDQRVFGGFNIYDGTEAGFYTSPIFEGLKTTIDGSFEAPITFLSSGLTVDADPTDGNLTLWGDLQLFGDPTGFWFEEGSTSTVPTIDQAQPDLEFRFTGTAASNDDVVTAGGQWTTQWERGAFGANDMTGLNNVQIRVPFEIWDIENNIQLEVVVINRNADDASPYANDVGTADNARWRISGRDYIIVLYKEYTDDPSLVRNLNDETATWCVFFNQAGAAVWSPGDIFQINYANPLQLGNTGDIFSFSSPEITYDATNAKSDVAEVNVYPNPYYGTHAAEINKYQRYVTFTHLPPIATLRIFNLAGQLVKTIQKEDPNQFQRWDLTNETALPVASGLYIVHIDMPELGETKILKVAIIQETQILDRF